MPVAVSPNKVCGTHVTDIRYREDTTGWDEPEDLPDSIVNNFREQKLVRNEKTVSSSYGR
jgi:hypothetical protein